MIAPNDPRHGSVAGHVAGCHCEPCQLAKYRYEKQRDYDAEHGRPRIIDATGTHRRIRALMALGWPAAAIAAEGGWGGREPIHQCLLHARVRRVKADRIAAAYDRLSMTPGPSRETRRRAFVAGWAPPLAWDDDEIDNPAARPNFDGEVDEELELDVAGQLDNSVVRRVLAGEKVPANRAERLEVARIWQETGRELNTLNRRHGWNIWRDRRLEAERAAA